MKREFTTSLLFFVWSILFVHLAKASTLSEFIGNYDPKLIYFAAGAAVLGGWIRTILSLQNDSRVVRDIFKEAMWDTGKALIAGMAVFFVIQSLRASGYKVQEELRFGAIVAAGWSRMAAVDWIVGLFKDWVQSKVKQFSDEPISKNEEKK